MGLLQSHPPPLHGVPWQVMKTMARKCTRSRLHSPEVLREEYVHAAFVCVDWDETEEVLTLFYIAKDLVQGRRAADELMLDWDDMKQLDPTASTAGGMVSAHVLNHSRLVGLAAMGLICRCVLARCRV